VAHPGSTCLSDWPASKALTDKIQWSFQMAKDDGMVICPNCGEAIRRTAKACPHCGSDEQTGWSEKTYLDGIDLPDNDDYDALVEKEFGNSSPHSPGRHTAISWKMVVGAALLLGFFLLIIRGF
jgi:ribosomal protein L32